VLIQVRHLEVQWAPSVVTALVVQTGEFGRKDSVQEVQKREGDQLVMSKG